MQSAIPADFSAHAGNLFRNPYPYYQWLRLNHPVYWDPNSLLWRLTRYQDIVNILRSPNISSHRTISFSKLKMTFLNESDPPTHTHFRRGFHHQYAMGIVDRLSGRIHEVVNALIAAIPPDGDVFDFITTYAQPLPRRVLHTMLDISDPVEQNSLIDLATDIGNLTGGGEGQLTVGQVRHAWRTIAAWRDRFEEKVNTRLEKPGTDLVSALAMMLKHGAIDMPEATGLCVEMSFAGVKNIANELGLVLYTLLNNPQKFEELRQYPERLPKAVSELLRYDTSVQILSRIATADIPLADQTIRSGDRIVLHLGAANRDDTMFVNADQLDFTRPNSQNLSFGYGSHFCLGMNLVAYQLETTLRALMSHFSAIELAGDVEWSGVLGYRGLKSLPIRVTR